MIKALYVIKVRRIGSDRGFRYMTDMGKGNRFDAMQFTRKQADRFVSLYSASDLEYRIIRSDLAV